MTYFPLPAAAEHAGFRPCKRCEPRSIKAPNPRVELVFNACRYIDDHLDNTLTLSAIGSVVGVSPYHLQRTFKRVMGVTPRQYADWRRLQRLKRELKGGESVTASIYGAGYGSSSRVYERAAPQLGMTPATYQRGGAGARISYVTAACSLGRVLVAATERGICFLSFGGNDADLEVALRREYPAAAIDRADDKLQNWVSAVVQAVDGREPHMELPLDVRATAFQRRVWEELQAIPYGNTRTYSDIAESIGHPTASRAVARACATNPVSLLIPCHRVLRRDGQLGGYRWGLERKQGLLEHERRMAEERIETE